MKFICLILLGALMQCKSTDKRQNDSSNVKRDEDAKNNIDSLMGINQFFAMMGMRIPRCPSDAGTVCVYDKLEDLTQNFGNSAAMEISPWAGFWWAKSMGGLSFRYKSGIIPENWYSGYTPGDGDGNTPYEKIYKPNYALFQSLTEEENLNSVALNDLSPAEKYDLLIRDWQTPSADKPRAWPLSNWNWEEKGTLANKKRISNWEGFCHGWAPASINFPEPLHPVTVNLDTPEGIKPVVFYPADIKGLLSLLYARTRAASQNFAGRRCNDRTPDLVDDESCFDTNPATFHKGLINTVAHLKTGLVVDISEGHQVWNNPIYDYEFKFINPATLRENLDADEEVPQHINYAKFDELYALADDNFESEIIPIGSYATDPYKTKRSTTPKKIVGVLLKYRYTREPKTEKHLRRIHHDFIYGQKYLAYDLEIDANGVITGGEWYSVSHPDFIWYVNDDDNPAIYGESDLNITANDLGNLSHNHRTAAFEKAKDGKPLYTILKSLLDQSMTNPLGNDSDFSTSTEDLQCLESNIDISSEQIGHFITLDQAIEKGLDVGETQSEIPDINEYCQELGDVSTARNSLYNSLEKLLAACKGLEAPTWLYCQDRVGRCNSGFLDYCMMR